MKQKYGRKQYDEDNTQMKNEDMNLEENAWERPNTKEEHQITALDNTCKNQGQGTELENMMLTENTRRHNAPTKRKEDNSGPAEANLLNI